MTPEIVVLTHFPSPYQVELFDAVDRLRPGALRVYYLHRADSARRWSAKTLNHSAAFLDGTTAILDEARRDLAAAPMAVFNYYAEPPVEQLMGLRAATGKPWAFWGERPGYQHPVLGRLVRRWRLRALHGCRAPIWGIGQWAVEAYRHEFGAARLYVNLPYFSDLSAWSGPTTASPGARTFLYSGTLSNRKGVDVLAKAFCRLAHAVPTVRLKILGAGPLERSLKTTLSRCSTQVEWLGFKDWHELGAVYTAAHVMCVPSRYDGWGLIVPEGLAAGLPVIATSRTGAALDLIRPGVNGWITQPDDEDGLYDCLRQAAGLDEQAWQEMSMAARASVREHSLADGARRFLEAADAARVGPPSCPSSQGYS